MPVAVWPPSLPVPPRLRDHRERPPQLTLRSSVDSGPAKVRRRNTANVRTISVSFVFTWDEWEAFDEFFLETIAGGALPFELKRPMTGVITQWRIVDTPEYRPLTPRPTAPEVGYVEVTFAAELLPGTGADEEDPDPDPPGDEDGQMSFAGDGFAPGLDEALAAFSPMLEVVDLGGDDWLAFEAAPPANDEGAMEHYWGPQPDGAMLDSETLGAPWVDIGDVDPDVAGGAGVETPAGDVADGSGSVGSGGGVGGGID